MLLPSFALASITCDLAFRRYMKYYKFENISQELFCQNLNSVSAGKRLGPKLGTDLGSTLNYQRTNQRKAADGSVTVVCQQYYCSATSLPKLPVIYQSVDLRTLGLVTRAKDQGTCGACYMFGGVAVLENAMLLDQKFVNFKINGDARALNLSELYGLTNVQYQNYCKGGNAISALAFLNDFRTSVNQGYYVYNVQKAADFPYNEQSVISGQKLFAAKQVYVPKISEANLPFQDLPAQANGQQVNAPTIILANHPVGSGQSFSTAEIQNIFSYLSRGQAVIAAMRVNVSGGQAAMSNYDGQGIIDLPCDGRGQDHQVTIIGYGKKQNKWVWIVKNSWGAGWGDSGSFYVPIGKNSFCIEQEATVIKSLHHDQRAGDLIFNRNQGFLTNYKKANYIDAGQLNLIQNDLQVACLLSNSCNPTVIPLSDGYDSSKFVNPNAHDPVAPINLPVYVWILIAVAGVAVIVGAGVIVYMLARRCKARNVKGQIAGVAVNQEIIHGRGRVL